MDITGRARERYRRYRELAGVAIVAIVAHLGYGVLNQSAIPPYVEVADWTPYIGDIYAAWLVSETVFKSPMGSLADIIGMRTVYVIASLVGAAAAFLWTVTHVLEFILFIRVIDGIASAGAWTVTIVAMGGSVGTRSRTGAMGLFVVTYLAALAFAPLLGGYANDTTGSKLTSFYVAGSLMAVAAIIALFLIPIHPHAELEQARTRTARTSLPSEIWLGIRSFPEYMVMAFATFFSIGVLVPIIKLFAMQELGLSETGYGLLVLPVASVLTVAALSAEKLAELIGKDHVVQMGIAVSAVAMYLVPWIHHPWELAVLAAIIGLGFAVGMPAWLALISDMSAPEVRGSVIGALGTGQGFGILTGVVMGGYLYSLHPIHVSKLIIRTHFAPFWISALGLSLCVVLGFIFIREDSGRYITA